jgi:hypothetical protein
LSNNAKRTHPKRDALTGRAKPGLEPICCAAQELTYEPELAFSADAMCKEELDFAKHYFAEFRINSSASSPMMR